MKITQYDPMYGEKLAVGETTLASGASGGSNSGFGGDVTGSWGDLSVVGLRRRVSLASNLTGVVGDVLAIVNTSPLTAQFATPSNTGASFGSNATRVSRNSSVGALSTSAREDHIHDGIGTVTSSSSNTLDRGTLNLRPGTNVAFALSDSDGNGGFDTLTISSSATGSGGSALTIEEVDGSPTVSATKLVLPNGTLSVVGTVATYTPAGGSSGALVLLEQHTASASATLDFTASISATYDEYQIDFVNIVPGTTNVTLAMQMGTGGGPTYDTAANYKNSLLYSGNGDNPTQFTSTTTALGLANSVSTQANYTTNGTIRLFNPGGTAAYKFVEGKVQSVVGAGNIYQWGVSGGWLSTTAATAFRFLFSVGTISSGTIRVYGIAK